MNYAKLHCLKIYTVHCAFAFKDKRELLAGFAFCGSGSNILFYELYFQPQLSGSQDSRYSLLCQAFLFPSNSFVLVLTTS